MKKLLVFLFSVAFLISCSDVDDFSMEKENNNEESTSERLNFADENALELAIESGLNSNANTFVKSAGARRFVSLMSKMPNLRSADGSDEQGTTYYEALGYDSLVPNENLAALLNPVGELEVGKEVIRITPNGTYKFPVGYEEEFNKFIKSNPDEQGVPIEENVNKIGEHIILYKTFNQNLADYDIVSEGDYELLPDVEDYVTMGNTKAASEPNFDSFQTFSADRKTWAGKLIQGIIGSTKESTVNFSKKRRVKGSFYFYNYGVYREIGVQGWTDKKNWIGWSKTPSDELRVGWTRVVLKKNIPDFYKQSMKSLNEMVYYPPQYMDVNGQRVNVATLAMPDFKGTFKDKVISQGSKAVFDFLKSELKRPATEWEKAEAFAIATRTELYFVSGTQHVVKYNTKSYTHVFANSWMYFTIGYSNKNGIFFNGINQNNVGNGVAWLNAISSTFNQSGHTSLVSGEVYSCARFGNDWRGMKIVKKP